jgi:hypothetical protein
MKLRGAHFAIQKGLLPLKKQPRDDQAISSLLSSAHTQPFLTDLWYRVKPTKAQLFLSALRS